MLFHWIKISIGMQKREIVFDAKSTDEHIDCFPNGHASASQKAVIFCTFQRKVPAT